MKRSAWIYQGHVDFFGISRIDRDGIIRYAIEEISKSGGDLQLRKLPNRYDTDRYKLYCEVGDSDPRTFWLMMRHLAALMPEDHPEQSLQGYDRIGMQREDLVIQGQKVFRQSWEWAPGQQRPLR